MQREVSKVRGVGGVSVEQTGMREGPCKVMEGRQKRSLAGDTRPAAYRDGAVPSPDYAEPARRPLGLVSLVGTRGPRTSPWLLPWKLM